MIENRGIATAAAAELVRTGVENVLKDPQTSSGALSEAPVPVVGISGIGARANGWTPKYATCYGVYEIQKRNPTHMLKSKGVFSAALHPTGPVPLNREQWRSALSKHGLDNRVSMNKRRETVANLSTRCLPIPMDLAHLDYASAMQLTWGSDLGGGN